MYLNLSGDKSKYRNIVGLIIGHAHRISLLRLNNSSVFYVVLLFGLRILSQKMKSLISIFLSLFSDFYQILLFWWSIRAFMLNSVKNSLPLRLVFVALRYQLLLPLQIIKFVEPFPKNSLVFFQFSNFNAQFVFLLVNVIDNLVHFLIIDCLISNSCHLTFAAVL